MVDQASVIVPAHGYTFDRAKWDYIVDKHDGYLPVVIKALPEGMVVDVGVPLLTIENTDPKCFWLTSFLETMLLRAVWYPTTVATLSWHIRQKIMKSLQESCDNPEAEIDFKLHDFGARGVSSDTSAAIGGLAHLVNFMGTDTMEALMCAVEYYNAKTAVGFSIPAAEHSTITSWGKENEAKAYENMIDQFSKPGSIYAVVSDSYDIYNAVENIWGSQLKEKVIASGGRLVVRPDSGVPHEVVLDVVMMLGETYGYEINKKGYKVLHPSVRVIQGDGINYESIDLILETLLDNGWSTENVAFGMGGRLLQGVDRDTLNFAMKCSAIKINGEWKDVSKNPVGDKNKKSKGGRFAVVAEGGKLICAPEKDNEWQTWLNSIFRDGELLVDHTFDELRARAKHSVWGV
jgi:nicotinamide phosphoribosyltransferase